MQAFLFFIQWLVFVFWPRWGGSLMFLNVRVLGISRNRWFCSITGSKRKKKTFSGCLGYCIRCCSVAWVGASVGAGAFLCCCHWCTSIWVMAHCDWVGVEPHGWCATLSPTKRGISFSSGYEEVINSLFLLWPIPHQRWWWWCLTAENTKALRNFPLAAGVCDFAYSPCAGCATRIV